MADVAVKSADHSASLGMTVGRSGPAYPAISGERGTVCAESLGPAGPSLHLSKPGPVIEYRPYTLQCADQGTYTRVAHVGILLNASNPSVMWGAGEGYSPTVS